MTREQLDRIPDRLLREYGTKQLRAWLHARGWHMSLLELGTERRARNRTSPARDTNERKN